MPLSFFSTVVAQGRQKFDGVWQLFENVPPRRTGAKSNSGIRLNTK